MAEKQGGNRTGGHSGAKLVRSVFRINHEVDMKNKMRRLPDD